MEAMQVQDQKRADGIREDATATRGPRRAEGEQVMGETMQGVYQRGVEHGKAESAAALEAKERECRKQQQQIAMLREALEGLRNACLASDDGPVLQEPDYAAFSEADAALASTDPAVRQAEESQAINAEYHREQAAGAPPEQLAELKEKMHDADGDPAKVEALYEEVEKCGKPAASLIPRWGMSYACVLDKGHEGECQPGGNCFAHGPYVGTTQCPHPIEECAKGATP